MERKLLRGKSKLSQRYLLAIKKSNCEISLLSNLNDELNEGNEGKENEIKEEEEKEVNEIKE